MAKLPILSRQFLTFTYMTIQFLVAILIKNLFCHHVWTYGIAMTFFLLCHCKTYILFFTSGNFLLLKLIMSFLHSTTKTGLFLVTEKSGFFSFCFGTGLIFPFSLFQGKGPLGRWREGVRAGGSDDWCSG